MEFYTSDINSVKPFLKKLHIPAADSHKGQNGRVLVIGGSKLFHASSIWAAEVASHFVDIVHFASTEENNQIFLEIKKKFHNGIIVSRINVPDYVKEDDAILIGPGMVRNENSRKSEVRSRKFSEILDLADESVLTRELVHYLLKHYPDKKFVIDAGALQMMDSEWLKNLKVPAIITPHQLEFERLFGLYIMNKGFSEKVELVKQTASEFKTVILLKAVDDIISDGTNIYIVKGGNQGLTKGGTGDILAGLSMALYAKNDPITSAVIASFILKKTADDLSPKYQYWYNNDNLIDTIAETFATVYSKTHLE